MPDNKDKQRKDTLRLLSLVTNIGLTTALCIVIGVGLGWLLDYLLGTSPLFMILLTVLGVAAAFKNIYDIGRKL